MSFSKYPEYIIVDDVKYKLNTDYRVAVRCFEIIADKNISDYERSLAVIYLLLGDIPEANLDKILSLLIKYLSCGESNDEPVKKDMDIVYDEKYIIASFQSDYHIDLVGVEYMHWYEFITLISGLTDDCILNRVRELRNCDVKLYKGDIKMKMLRAKAQVALPTQDEEDSEEMEEFNRLLGG